jgi:hypothetical protein
MKHLLVALAIALSIAAPAAARPQLHTQSIGWIDPTDISCEQTSDHTCVVTKGCGDCAPMAYTWQDQVGDRAKYQVKAGTELVIVNEGHDNDAELDNQANVYTHRERVEVAIVIPADWDSAGQLRANQPCHLMLRGKSRPVSPGMALITPTVLLPCERDR